MPNCGCDTWRKDSCFRGDQPAGTCRSCGLHYQIFADGIKKSSVGFETNRKDKNGNTIMEYPVLSPHPRKGIQSWHWEAPDLKPEYGEYWSPRGIGYDLSGFVKSKQVGERLLKMVKEALGKPKLRHGLIGENMSQSGFSLNFRKRNLIWRSWRRWLLKMTKF